MPDEADVEAALAGVVAGALYPDGAEAASAVGAVCRVYRGWPTAAALEADLAGGAVHVTVQPVAGSVRITTRYPAEWQGAVPAPGLLVRVNGEVVSFTGPCASGQVAGLLVDGAAHAYRMRMGDTAGLVAAALAELVRVRRPADLEGDTVRLPGGRGIAARVVADGHGGTELRRQQMNFRLTAWCPGPEIRDQVGAAVDLALARQAFLDVGGWGCRVQASGGSVVDSGSAAGIWRRDLVYSVEYPTVAESSLPTMLFGAAVVGGASFTV